MLEVIMNLHGMLNIFPREILYFAHRATWSESPLLGTLCYSTEHEGADVSEDFVQLGGIFADCQLHARPFCIFQVCTRCRQPLCKADVTDCRPRAEGGAQGREGLARACPTVSDGAGVLHTQAVLVQMQTSFPTAVTWPSNASLRPKGKVCSQFGRDFQEGCPDHGWDIGEKENLDFFFFLGGCP